MTDLVFDDPCLLFALGREAKSFLREFKVQQRFPAAPCRARFCGPEWLSVLVVETGVGAARMKSALDWLLSRPQLGNVAYRPKLVLSAGYSGALVEKLRVGDIVLATEVCDLAGKCWLTTWPAEPLSGAWQPPLQRGRILTATKLVATAEEKVSLARQYDAVAVDMETAVVAHHCTRHGIPFGCVRAISDDVHTPLSPRLVTLVSDGRVSLGRVAAAVLRSPGLVKDLWRLVRLTRFAAAQLGAALGELLTLTLPWAQDG